MIDRSHELPIARLWRGNLDEKSATIWMRFFGRGDEIICYSSSAGDDAKNSF
jgi:hypothetical protein